MSDQELIIPISGMGDLKVNLGEPLPAGTKLLGIIHSRSSIAEAAGKLGLRRRIIEARRKCEYNMRVTPRAPGSITVPFGSATQCGGFVFSHFKGKLSEYCIMFEHRHTGSKRMGRSDGEIFGRLWPRFVLAADESGRTAHILW